MTDVTGLICAIHEDAETLDALGKRLNRATSDLDRAEAAWDEAYDLMAESLKDDMAAEGRKGDPAEHYVTSVTRRAHRDLYQDLRRQKRAVELIERLLQAKRAALNGRQSELAALRDEVRVQDRVGQPAWTGEGRQPRAAA